MIRRTAFVYHSYSRPDYSSPGTVPDYSLDCRPTFDMIHSQLGDTVRSAAKEDLSFGKVEVRDTCSDVGHMEARQTFHSHFVRPRGSMADTGGEDGNPLLTSLLDARSTM